jgi:sugar phosphate isomerase/epimerase
MGNRRDFLKKSFMAAAVTGAASNFAFGNNKNNQQEPKNKPFKLKYAPPFGMFKESAGADVINQISFCKDNGFRAMFDNGLMKRNVTEQEKIAAEISRQGMELGPFVLYADFSVKSFVTRDPAIKDMLIKLMKEGVEVKKRTGIKWALVVPGRFDEKLEWDYQTANVIDNLKYCCDILEPAGLTMVLEPLNAWTDHPGLFLTKMPQAFQICKAVNSPVCKINNDIYHQQITEGNIIPNIDKTWDYIGAFHVGDNPGRNEPTTGEINYKNIFKHIYDKKYTGTICMEHGKSLQGIEGEKAIITAYRYCDSY